MSNFGMYGGREFMEMKLPKREFLIDKFIREKDSVILVGDAKAGKTLMAYQMICSLTTQHPFLDRFKVRRACKVAYVQAEGELEDTQDRLKRMTNALDFDADNFQIFYTSGLDLEERHYALEFTEKFREFAPDFLILDPVYASFNGDLNDNNIVRAFNRNLRIVKDSLNCGVMLIHHTHNIRLNKKGEIMNEGDNAIFGSKFFKAWADHILLFVYDQKNELRILQCQTQRSGSIEKKVKTVLKEPDPLYFEEIEQNPTREDMVISSLMKCGEDGMSKDDFMKLTKLSESCFYRTVKRMVGSTVRKDDTKRPVRYHLKADAC